MDGFKCYSYINFKATINELQTSYTYRVCSIVVNDFFSNCLANA